MAKAPNSGYIVKPTDVPVILGMLARGDRNHDVAARFGLNQGRIKEIKDGKHGTPPLAAVVELHPFASPGPKARGLKAAVEASHKLLKAGKHAEAEIALSDALDDYSKSP